MWEISFDCGLVPRLILKEAAWQQILRMNGKSDENDERQLSGTKRLFRKKYELLSFQGEPADPAAARILWGQNYLKKRALA
ncbi:MAG: hypothetical protein H7318_16715 [Oligoflexus sp.]|nr:hypothetical protein [Oligoflexus sp.]